MEFSNLIALVLGWVLSQAGNWLSNRQAVATSLVLARDHRRYEVGKEAYKSAMTAFSLGLDIIDERRRPTAEEMPGIVVDFFNPIRDARIAFGLPVTKDTNAELLSAIFLVPTVAQEGGDVETVAKEALAIIQRHRNEIMNAWREVLHGVDRSDQVDGRMR